MFGNDVRIFYRELVKKASLDWEILEEVKHNEDAQWIKDKEEQLGINQME